MEAIFEAKYISIKWYDKNRVSKIDEAILPISIEVENETTYSMELQTYTRIEKGLDGQVAFYLLDTKSTIEPYFLDASNNKVPLLKIVDPKNNKTWWIEDGKWSKQYKYRSSPLWNHIGESKIKFGNIECNINIRANSFTKEQLDLYLNDFRNDFWYLILQQDSLTQGNAKNKKVKLLDNESIKFISKFIEYSEKILLNPKKELREVQRLKDIKKVKPVVKTFMEIATRGFTKKLTSRDTVESYNVPENRYIYYAIQYVYTIVFNILNASGHIKDIYEKKSESDKERLNSFTDFKTIDKEVLANEIKELQTKYDNEIPSLHKCIYQQNRQIDISQFKKETIFVQVWKRTNNEYKFEFFGNMKKNSIDDWSSFKDEKYRNTKYKDSFYMISFNKLFDQKIQSNYEYEITGYIVTENVPRDKIGYKLKREFIFISNIKIIKSKVKEKLDLNILEKKDLEKSNWKRKLNAQERQEQEYEKEALRKSTDMLKDEQSRNLELIKSLEPSLNKLKKLLIKFKELKIKKDSYFPNSMTFVQNPNYQGSHKSLKKIKDMVGIDESLFSLMQDVEKIGLLDIPTIYERWCFLQIIKVLIEKYHFIPEKNWKTKLANQVMGNLNNIKNVKISFTNEEIARDIDLWYEKEYNAPQKLDQ